MNTGLFVHEKSGYIKLNKYVLGMMEQHCAVNGKSTSKWES